MLKSWTAPEQEIASIVSFMLAHSESFESYEIFCVEADAKSKRVIELMSNFPERIKEVEFPKGSILQKELYRVACELKKAKDNLQNDSI